MGCDTWCQNHAKGRADGHRQILRERGSHRKLEVRQESGSIEEGG